MLNTDIPIEKLLAGILKEQEKKLSSPIITIREIEQDYKISKRELVPIVKAHKIPVIRINQRVFRFYRADIEQFIAEKTIAAVVIS
jgi:predicted DNA-binding transcriptional regulator AlpA